MIRTHRWTAATFACAALALTGTGCASTPEDEIRRPVTVMLEVKNDVMPPGAVEVFVLPYNGNWHDRVEVGVVESNAEASFRVAFPDRGRYTLYARRLATADNDVRAFPFYRPRVDNAFRSRRFSVTPGTQRIEWLMRADGLEVREGSGGSS